MTKRKTAQETTEAECGAWSRTVPDIARCHLCQRTQAVARIIESGADLPTQALKDWTYDNDGLICPICTEEIRRQQEERRKNTPWWSYAILGAIGCGGVLYAYQMLRGNEGGSISGQYMIAGEAEGHSIIGFEFGRWSSP